MPKDDNCKSDKRISKWLLITIVFTLFLVLGGTVFFTTQNSAVQERIAQKKLEKETFIWPETDIASLLPVPQSNNGHIEINNENELLVEIYNATQDDFHEYLLRSNIRFDKYEKRNEIYYSAYDEEGNILELDYYSANQKMKIHVYESREAQILQGIEHYELEYYSCYASETMRGMKNYDRVLKKYLTPAKTTVGELKKDFPFDETSPGHEKSVPNQNINLDDNTEIWAYATYLDNYNCDVVKFIYDDLRISKDTLEIKTHFEIIEELGSSTKKFRLIVISIIPVNQSLSIQSPENIDNLLYYGKSALHVDKGNNIIIQLATLDDYDSVKSVCVYNCQAKKEILLPVSGEVKYTAEDSGSYYIYAIMNDGKSLDLIDICGIEHSHTVD